MLAWRATHALAYALHYLRPRAAPRKDGLCPVPLRLTSDCQPTYRAIPDMAR